MYTNRTSEIDTDIKQKNVCLVGQDHIMNYWLNNQSSTGQLLIFKWNITFETDTVDSISILYTTSATYISILTCD